ncbi:MAG TPA: hypothetical protein PLU72_11025 [Candidatus Ozemobacteraceae bacterium]|nr:hypothetical protein [Candidatus Ozemobacteraceae bacterium]
MIECSRTIVNAPRMRMPGTKAASRRMRNWACSGALYSHFIDVIG